MSSPRKPQVLFIVPLPPPLHGASMQSQLIVESAFLNEKLDLRVLPLRFTREHREIGRFSWSKIGKMLSLAGRLVSEVTTKKPDLACYVLTHRGYSFYRDCLFVFLLKLFRVPIVFHQRNRGVSDPDQSGWVRALRKKLLANTDSIVLSPLLIDDVAPFVPRERIHVVPNGLPAEPVPARTEANPVPVILFLSNLIVEKGVFVLLEAMARLHGDGCAFRGVFAGSWSYNLGPRDFHERVSALGLDGVVESIGPVYGEEKSRLLAESDVFVFPTFMKHETFGNVVLEAMRASLPVVTSDQSSLPFIVEHGRTGYVCRQRDAEDVANRLKALIADPTLRERMGNNGRERFLSRFTFEEFERNFMRVLDVILERS